MDNTLVRTILAVVLSIVVIILYQNYFMPKPQPPQEAPARSEEKAPESPQPVETAQEEAQKPAQPVEKVDEAQVSESLTSIQADSESTPSQAEKKIVVDTSLYKAVFSTKGGTIVSWKLKKHLDMQKQPVNLLNFPGKIMPLGIVRDGRETDALLKVNYETSSENLILTKDNPSETLTFLYRKGDMVIKKIFVFHWDNYKVDFTLETDGVPSLLLTLGTDFGIFEKADKSHYGPVLLRYSDREEFNAADLNEAKYYDPPVAWIAQEDKYFGAALAPLTPLGRVRVWGDGKEADIGYEIKPGKVDFVFYAGPKEYDRLKSLQMKLEHIVNFGWSWIQPVARPLFALLKFFYKYLHNYGLAIIVLTIIVRIPFIPLISKGQQSMKKLQALQPKIMEIREKYKNNPQKMNAELMELYKTQKANPVGGCLPMLLQVPIFIALYNVLYVAVELRNAPFYFWIQDLSQKDPYYVLPIIMGISMLIQQKMTPSTVDPTQAKIMMLLPIVFTFLFINFPSGLVLYWLVNNILAIGQQYYINKKTA